MNLEKIKKWIRIGRTIAALMVLVPSILFFFIGKPWQGFIYLGVFVTMIAPCLLKTDS